MKVLLDNDRVRVQLHATSLLAKRRSCTPYPAYIAYMFNPYTAKSASSDGTEATLGRRAGDAFYSGPVGSPHHDH